MHRSRRRVLLAAVAGASVSFGAIAGCGIDDLASLVIAGDDASDEGHAVLPDGATDGNVSSDGPLADGGDGDADADAGVVGSCVDSGCSTLGGACDDGGNVCTFQCAAKSSCAGPIQCPPGVPCKLDCAGDDSCGGGIDCTRASSCDITCSGKNACGAVACSGSRCSIACNGPGSCKKGTECDASDSCAIACDGGGTDNCDKTITCESKVCSVFCGAEGCDNGATATAADASIVCGNNACAGGAGATCDAPFCYLACAGGACHDELCCNGGGDGGNGDGGTCVLDGGDNKCP